MSPTVTRTWTEMKQPDTESRRSIPEGLWLRCPSCGQMIYRRQMESNQHVCPECGHHFRIGAAERIRQLADPDTFVPMFTGLRPRDPLSFTDLKTYPDRVRAEQVKTGENEGCQAGEMFIKGRATMVACLDLTFMMGSMGSVVG
ncbi:MAG: acetyl-CoA carboxylase carboxyl transferase subunit beta, partial [Planctomycetota bacterium]